MTTSRETGLLIGKFLPPHNGHVALVDFARRVSDLTVLVCSLTREPIPGEFRHRWMRELFPDVNVVHVTDENPQEPHEHPEFWRIWRETLLRAQPKGADLVFASEPYGARLAQEIGARFVPVDLARDMVPVSGTQVRTDPMKRWAFIPAPVRPYFVRRVCVVGPESTGKSTLARALAERYDTVHVNEYARTWLEQQARAPVYSDMDMIVRCQHAAEDAMARQANRVMFCDTDALTTSIWSDVLFASRSSAVTSAMEERRYDLTLLTDVDVPFVPDPVRYLPARREEFMERCVAALRAQGRAFVRVSGDWDARMETAVRAVDALLRRPQEDVTRARGRG